MKAARAPRARGTSDAASEPAAPRAARVQVRVKPNARQSSFEAVSDGSYLAHLKAAPVDGKANEELLALAARHFGLRRAQVVIDSGASGRVKLIRLLG